jgi:hypothetical protein
MILYVHYLIIFSKEYSPNKATYVFVVKNCVTYSKLFYFNVVKQLQYTVEFSQFTEAGIKLHYRTK